MFPKPIKICSIQNIKSTWSNSRDSSGEGGAPGGDKVSPRQYREALDANISSLSRKLISGTYNFHPLKYHLLEKGGGKFRVICVPTVEDRLVQRLILRHLTYKGDRLGILTSVSYGIKKGSDSGVHSAIETAIKYRQDYPWVLKTDISQFFDKIPRDYLIAKIKARLGRSSLIPLLEGVVNSEIKILDLQHKRIISDCGILKGRGLRQGMPLSPLLSNLVLNGIDRKIERRGFKIIRYADDLIGFGSDKSECMQMMHFIKAELAKLKLEIPTIDVVDTKTTIHSPNIPVIFLGMELYEDSSGIYKIRIPEKTWARGVQNIRQHGDLAWNIKNGHNFSSVVKRLNEIILGYRSAFRGCDNLVSYEATLLHESKMTKEKILKELFSDEVLARLTSEKRSFLGIA